jgi:hypothetical protein
MATLYELWHRSCGVLALVKSEQPADLTTTRIQCRQLTHERHRGSFVGSVIGQTEARDLTVASAPAAFRVRVWQIMSRAGGRGRGNRYRRVLVLPTLADFTRNCDA